MLPSVTWETWIGNQLALREHSHRRTDNVEKGPTTMPKRPGTAIRQVIHKDPAYQMTRNSAAVERDG
jgi:hypothetical protein